MIAKRARRPSDRAFAVFRRRVVEQVPTGKVAEEFKINQQRVRFLVKRVSEWSRQYEGVGEPLAIKIQHTAMLYELYRDAREQYRRSCEEATSYSAVTMELTGPKGPSTKKTTRLSRHGQSGNPRYLEIADQLLSSIRGIWGADAPKQMDISTTDEQHVTVVTITDRAALALAKIDEELARRGCVLDAACADRDAGDARGDRGSDENRPAEGS